MSEELKLLPCPNCGHKQPLECEYNEACRIECVICGMSGPSFDYLPDAEEAWNSLPRRSDIERADANLSKQKSPAKTKAIAFTGKNVQRWSETPGCGMVADNLGRWVSFEEHNEQLLRLERQLDALAVFLAQHQGRSVTYWREYARIETKAD